MQTVTSPFLTLSEVSQITTLGKTRIYEMIKDQKSGFPRSFSISTRAVRWYRVEVENWVNQKIATRGKEAHHG
jgi:predicted DNA-binding transcriptional regulator AlpA